MKRRLRTLFALGIVIWLGGSAACYWLGSTSMEAATACLVHTGFLNPGVEHCPPDEGFFSAHALLRLARFSPFRGKAMQRADFHVRQTTSAAFLVTGKLAGRVPAEWKPGEKEQWQRFIAWIEDHRGSLGDSLPRFDEPQLGQVLEMAVLSNGRTALVRRLPVHSPYLEVVDAKGRSLWTSELPERFDPQNNGIWADDRRLFLRLDPQGDSLHTRALDLATGATLWEQRGTELAEGLGVEFKRPSGSSEASDGNRVFQALQELHERRVRVFARNAARGNLLWTRRIDDVRLFSRLLVVEGRVVVQHSHGTVVLDSDNGEVVFTQRSSEPCTIVAPYLYCQSGDTLTRHSLVDLSQMQIAKLPDHALTGMGGERAGVHILLLRRGPDALGALRLKAVDALSSEERWDFFDDETAITRCGPSDLWSEAPEGVPFSGDALPRYVVLKGESREGERLVVIDLDERRIAWKSKPLPALLHWKLVRGGKRFFLSRWNEPLAVFDGETGRIQAAVRMENAWGPAGVVSSYLDSDRLLVMNGNGWGTLRSDDLRLVYREGSLPPLDEQRSQMAEWLGAE